MLAVTFLFVLVAMFVVVEMFAAAGLWLLLLLLSGLLALFEVGFEFEFELALLGCLLSSTTGSFGWLLVVSPAPLELFAVGSRQADLLVWSAGQSSHCWAQLAP